MPIPFPEQPEPPRRPVEFDAPDAGMPDHALGRSSVAPLIDPHWAELSRLVGRAETNRAEMSRLQAERAELCAEALDLVAMRVAQRQAARPSREIGDTIPLREVMAELAAALRVGERTVSTWLGDGSALVTTYPTTLDALREGRIDERHASAIIDGGGALNPEHREEYERLVLEVAERDTAPATRQFARVVAARLQPETVDESHRRALAERRVRMFDLDDGLSRLLLDGATAVIHGIFDRLTSMGIARGISTSRARMRTRRPTSRMSRARPTRPTNPRNPMGGRSTSVVPTSCATCFSRGARRWPATPACPPSARRCR